FLPSRIQLSERSVDPVAIAHGAERLSEQPLLVVEAAQIPVQERQLLVRRRILGIASDPRLQLGFDWRGVSFDLGIEPLPVSILGSLFTNGPGRWLALRTQKPARAGDQNSSDHDERGPHGTIVRLVPAV